ncbi:glycosyltransferase [Agromyces sp. CCNWLW203]|uniref:glycosyltransferase n=1 Tax=Agromyces sp. CCNWLW203 TaxID=3112842 RepID=UPI002F960B9C
MKILFIHEVNYTEKVIFEMHEFPELLSLRGHDVSFFHFPEHPRVPRRSLRSSIRVIPGRVHPEARIRLITPPTLGGGSLDRYLAPLLGLPALRREIVHGGYDLIVLYAVPTTGWQTVSIARRHDVPVVFRALDVSHGIRDTPVTALIKLAERHVYRTADSLSANNPAMARYCVEASGRTGPTRVDIAPVDLSHFEREAQSDIRPELGLSASDRVLLYMGTFFPFSGLDTVIRALPSLIARDPAVRLLLVGGGELEGTLRATVEELSLEHHVIFTGVVPYSVLPEYLAVGDVGLNPFEPGLVTDIAIPHKVLQYMAAGLPVVSTDLEGLHGVLGDESGVTFVTRPGEVADAAYLIAASDDAARAAIADRQREFADVTFSEEAAVAAFEEHLRTVG